MEKVSVLIPAFNSEKYVAKSVIAAINQTVKAFEILVYDDGSTDGTVDAISKLPVRIVKGKENMGIGFARKRLVEEAKGEYVCFISSDDLLLPDYIEEMLKASKDHPNCILFCDYNVISEDGVFIDISMSNDYDVHEDWVMSNIIRARANTMSVCYNIFSPARILKENNFDDKLRYGEDLEHLLRCTLIKDIKYFHVNIPLFDYRRHRNATTEKYKTAIPKNNKKIFKQINRLIGRKII